MLDGRTRGRLIEALCARYPSYDQLALFLALRDRSLPMIAAPGALPHVVFTVVTTAEAGGWIDGLISAAAADAPHIPALQEIAAARAAPADEPSRPVLDLGLILPPGSAVAAAVRADPRVARVGCFRTVADADGALDGVHALVVSTEVMWSGGTAGGHLRPWLRAVPVVLLEPADRAPAVGRPVVTWPTESVIQIVVEHDPTEAARRIVDHLAEMVRG